MEYYYTNRKNVSESGLIIEGKEAHHIKDVLRRKIGDELFVTDGERNLYKVIIEHADKEGIRCNIKEKFHNLNEPQKYIKLFLALLKNPSRFEFAIEKCVEIGICEITPIITEHVVNKKMNKQERWQSIALSAMKQSQRCYLPCVKEPLDFQEAIKEESGLKLLADERETKSIEDSLFKKENEISLFIGPEGGFSNEEVELAQDKRIHTFSLGKRKLRSETAAIVGTSRLIS